MTAAGGASAYDRASRLLSTGSAAAAPTRAAAAVIATWPAAAAGSVWLVAGTRVTGSLPALPRRVTRLVGRSRRARVPAGSRGGANARHAVAGQRGEGGVTRGRA